VAQSIVLAQIQQSVQASGDPPAARAEEFARLRNQVRVASWRIFAAADFDRPEVVEDEAVATFYRDNQVMFTTPERLRIAYLRLDPRALEAGIDVTQEDVREHYALNAQRYEEPELRRVRQIQIDRDAADADSRIRELRARIEAGEDLAELAAEYSEDRLSADRGGDMGRIARGDLDRVLETVIFSLPKGLVSQPVQTRLGWHVVEVVEIEESRLQPFEEVREEVERDLRDRRAEQRQIQVLDDLLSQTFENPESLGPASSATGLEVRTTDWFTRESGEGVAQYRPVREAAFSTPVRRDGRNSEAVDLPDGSTLVLRVQERQEPFVRPVEEVAAEIREILQQDAAAQAARERGEELLEALADGRTVTELAEEDPEPWTLSASVNRSTGPEPGVELPGTLMNRLFQLRAPRDDEVVTEGVRLAAGDFAVIVLESVRMLEPAEAVEDLRRVADDLQIAYSGAELRAYLAWLESEAKIRRYPQNLE